MALKILILEDSVHDAELIQYEVRKGLPKAESKIVHNYVDFRDEYDHWQPDVVLSDFNLPDISGIEVLDYVRRNNQSIPFIAISGSITPDMEVKLLRKQASDVLTKNNLNRLNYAIQRALTELRQKNELKEITEFQTTMSDVSLIFNSLKSFDEKVNEALSLIGEVVDASRAYVFSDVGRGNIVKNTHEWCAVGIEPQIKNLQNLPYSMVPSFKPMLIDDGGINERDVTKLPEDLIQMFQPQNIKSILVYPVLLKNKYIGFIGIDETKRNRKWRNSEKNLLQTFTSLYSNAYNEELNKQKLLKKNKQLQYLLDEKETLIQEVHHRVKNNLALVSGFLSLEMMTHHDPEIEQVINANLHRVKSLAIVHELIYKTRNFSRVDIVKTIQKITDDIGNSIGLKNLTFLIESDADKINMSVNQAIPFSLYLVEIFNSTVKTKSRNLWADINEPISCFIKLNDGIFSFEMRHPVLYKTFPANRDACEVSEVINALCEQLDAELITNSDHNSLRMDFKLQLTSKGFGSNI